MAAQAHTQVRVTRRRFTTDEYHRMGEAGIFGEDDRVELIDGEIVETGPIGPRHMWCVSRLDRLLHQQLGDDVIISVQNPIRLSVDGEPQPDVVVLRDWDDPDTLPTVDNVLLVIEVSDTTLAYDCGVKLPLYAAAGVPESWIADLKGARLERHTEPRDGEYRSIAIARRGESLTSTVLPTLALAVDDVLG